MSRAEPAENDNREALVAAVRDWGIRYLAPSDHESGSERLSPAELISRLAGHTDPRLNLALVPLFFLHPELAEELHGLKLPGGAQDMLMKHYTAAACVQRMWRTRLGFYIEREWLLPDLYSSKLGVPPVKEHYGEACLHALDELDESSLLSAYEGVMDLLFDQLRLEHRRQSASPR